MNITEFKDQYPAYKDIPDEDLALKLHSKFYSSIDKDVFLEQVGVRVKSAPVEPLDTTAIDSAGVSPETAEVGTRLQFDTPTLPTPNLSVYEDEHGIAPDTSKDGLGVMRNVAPASDVAASPVAPLSTSGYQSVKDQVGAGAYVPQGGGAVDLAAEQAKAEMDASNAMLQRVDARGHADAANIEKEITFEDVAGNAANNAQALAYGAGKGFATLTKYAALLSRYGNPATSAQDLALRAAGNEDVADALYKEAVAPMDRMIAFYEKGGEALPQTFGTKVSNAVGDLAATLPAIVATGGGANPGTKYLFDISKYAFSQGMTREAVLAIVKGAKTTLGDAITTMLPASIPSAVDRYNKLREQGVDLSSAAQAAFATFATTSAIGAVPLWKAGNVATRAATGVVGGAALSPISIEAQNIALRDYEKLQADPLDVEAAGVSGIVGGVLAAGLGGKPQPKVTISPGDRALPSGAPEVRPVVDMETGKVVSEPFSGTTIDAATGRPVGESARPVEDVATSVTSARTIDEAVAAAQNAVAQPPKVIIPVEPAAPIQAVAPVAVQPISEIAQDHYQPLIDGLPLLNDKQLDNNIKKTQVAVGKGDVAAEPFLKAAIAEKTRREDAKDVQFVEPTGVQNNASGESAASVEANNRLASENAAGQDRVRLNVKSGEVTPLVTSDRVDATPYANEVILQRGIGKNEWTPLDAHDTVQTKAIEGAINRAIASGKLAQKADAQIDVPAVPEKPTWNDFLVERGIEPLMLKTGTKLYKKMKSEFDAYKPEPVEVPSVEKDFSLTAEGGAFKTKTDASLYKMEANIDAEVVKTDNGFVLKPNDVPLSEEGYKNAESKVAELNAAIKRSGGGDISLLPMRNEPAGSGYIKAIARIFKTDVIFIENNKHLEGVAHDGRVFLSDNAPHKVAAVIGHEVEHVYEKRSPERAIALQKEISRYVKSGVIEKRQATENKLMSPEEKAAGRTTSMETAANETFADISGSMWADPLFWKGMRERSKSLYNQTSYAYMEAATRAVKAMGKARFDTSELVSDVNAVREAMIAEWTERAEPTHPVNDKSSTEVDFARKSDVGHKRTKEGYVGAPPGMTPAKLGHLRLFLAKMAKEGESGKMWYEDSSRAILEAAGGDKELAKKIAGLFSIYSQNATVAANTTIALNALYQWSNGQKIDARFGKQDERAQAWMDGTLDAEDAMRIKTGNFYLNLMYGIDPSIHIGGSTMDMWMARIFGFNKTAPSATNYAFMERETARLAKELGWEPHQAQAAMWVSIKSRIDEIREKAMDEAIQKAVVPHRNTIKYNAAQEAAYEKILLKHAIGIDPSKNNIQKSAYDFSHAIQERIGQISWEAAPGKSTGILPGIFNATLGQQAEYLQAIDSALRDSTGRDVIAKKLNIPLIRTIFGPSAWEGNVGAGAQDLVAMHAPSGVVGEATTEVVNLYSAIRGLVLHQEAVTWHYPNYSSKKADANGMEANFGRAPNADEMQVIYSAISNLAGHKEFAPAFTPNGIRVGNFTKQSDNTAIHTENIAFHSIITKAIRSLPDGFMGGSAEIKRYSSLGKTFIGNDWSNGDEGYRQRIREAGRSDLLKWVDGELVPAIEKVNREFSEKYGWGAATRSEVAESVGRSSEGSPQYARRESVREQKPDALTQSVTHYGMVGNLAELSARRYGAGIKGAEASRLTKSNDPNIKNRVYFYTNDGTWQTKLKEAGLGNHVYTVELTNLYDLAKDPANVAGKIAGLTGDERMNAMESAIAAAGYDGYANGQMVVALGIDVPVDYNGISRARNEAPVKAEPQFSRKEPIWYSQMLKVLPELKTDKEGKVGAEQARLWLMARVKDGKIKSEEYQWSGIDEYLRLQKGKVSLADIQKFVENNGAAVREVIRVESDSKMDLYERNGRWYVIDEKGNELDNFRSESAALEYMDDRGDGAMYGPNSDHGNLTLPGGSDYKELLLTLKPKSDVMYMIKKNGNDTPTFRSVYYSKEAALDAIDNYLDGASDADIIKAGFSVEPYFSKSTKTLYKSSHWSDPNILASVRMNTRYDAQGNKVLFIEEIQSDYAADARKYGVRDTAAINKFIDSIRGDAVDALIEKSGTSKEAAEKEVSGMSNFEIADWAGKAQEFTDIQNKTNKAVNPAPYVGKTDAWVSLVIKRIARYAADNGFDKVAFINGEQTADRYDLSKQVDAVRVNLTPDGTYDIGILPIGKKMQHYASSVSKEKLADHIGKDLAEKAISDVVEVGADAGKIYYAKDLKVGGEGMIKFYDQIVPQVISKTIAKLRSKLESINIPDVSTHAFGMTEFSNWMAKNGYRENVLNQWETTGFRVEEFANDRRGDLIQQGFSVTPKMEESMPMYSRNEPKTTPGAWMLSNAKDFVNKIGDELAMAVVPMSQGSDIGMVTAKQYANSVRAARWKWDEIDKGLKEFTPEEQKLMWEAGDEHGVRMRQGLPTEGFGLDRLDERQRATVDRLHELADSLLQRAIEVGMFKGEGLDYWMPRVGAIKNPDGSYSPLSSGGSGAAIGKIGGGFTTSSPNLKQRKYLTSEETEKAMKGLFEDQDVELIKNIRMMPRALSRLESAIAGRELINQIREVGKLTGQETTNGAGGKGYFTIPQHPAFYETKPRFIVDEDGKYVPAIDQNGNMQFDRTPIYISDEFKGGLKAVLNGKSGAIYSAMMQLKARTMSVIMYSPLIHNFVEWGRAFPMMPLKMLTLQVYRDGDNLLNDPVEMKKAIDNGLVPISGRAGVGGFQDISNVMAPESLELGQSWTAKLLAAPVGIVSKSGAEMVKRGVDKAGEIVHYQMLWKQVARLQAGLYLNIKQRLLDKGMDEYAASVTAAHNANRYAGMMPDEAMSELARKSANIAFFSRMFTFGNLGVMKDMFTGLPRAEVAMIKLRAGEEAAKDAKNAGKRMARGAFMIDIAMMYIFNALLQHVFAMMFGDKDREPFIDGYIRRAAELSDAIGKNPLILATQNPFNTIARIFPNSENEPGKKERIFIKRMDDGTGLYIRFPVGKIGEEFKKWPSEPITMLNNKLSTQIKPIAGIIQNQAAFGRPLYQEGEGAKVAARNIWAATKLIIASQFPVDSVDSAYTLAEGKGGIKEVGKVFGPLVGVNVSSGYPGGPEKGEIADFERKQKSREEFARVEIREAVRKGDIDKAYRIGEEAEMNQSELRKMIRNYENPERISPNKRKDFNKRAGAEEQARATELSKIK